MLQLRDYRLVTVVAILLVFALALSACTGEEPPPAEDETGGTTEEPPAEVTEEGPVEGGTVTIAMWTAPSGTFNPWVAESAYDTDPMENIVIETLLRANDNLLYEYPNLATGYEITESGDAITFFLREGVQWHDGEDFTAEDVAYTIEFILDPNYPGAYAEDFMPIVGAEAYQKGEADEVEGIEIVDDHTITLHLTRVYGPAVATFGGMYVLPKHYMEGMSIAEADKAEQTKHPIGTGPYKFVQYVTDQYVELEKNPNWWGDGPYIDTIIWQVINQEVATGAFMNGEVDAMGVGASNTDPADLELLEGLENVDVWEQPDLGYQHMFFNLTRPIFQDVRVRQAFAYGINRQAMVDQILEGCGTVMNGPILPVSWAYSDAVNPYEYNVDTAKQLLKEAGWEDLDDDGIAENADGEEFTVTLTYPAGNPLREKMAPLIQDDLKKIGVNAELEMVDFDTLIDRVMGEVADFDLGLLGWNLALDPDQITLWMPGTPYNFTRFDNEEAWELLQQGAYSSMDPEVRKTYYQDWVKLMNEQLPYVFMYTQNKVHVFNTNRLKGYYKGILGPQENIHEWWIPTEAQGGS